MHSERIVISLSIEFFRVYPWSDGGLVQIQLDANPTFYDPLEMKLIHLKIDTEIKRLARNLGFSQIHLLNKENFHRDKNFVILTEVVQLILTIK